MARLFRYLAALWAEVRRCNPAAISAFHPHGCSRTGDIRAGKRYPQPQSACPLLTVSSAPAVPLALLALRTPCQTSLRFLYSPHVRVRGVNWNQHQPYDPDLSDRECAANGETNRAKMNAMHIYPR